MIIWWPDVVGAGIVADPPFVVTKNPNSSDTGISIGTNIVVTFNEDLNPATVTTSTFKLDDGALAPVTGVVTYSSSGFTATFNPSSDLNNSEIYTVTLVGGGSGIKDAGGEEMDGNVVWTFTTAAVSSGNTYYRKRRRN